MDLGQGGKAVPAPYAPARLPSALTPFPLPDSRNARTARFAAKQIEVGYLTTSLAGSGAKSTDVNGFHPFLQSVYQFLFVTKGTFDLMEGYEIARKLYLQSLDEWAKVHEDELNEKASKANKTVSKKALAEIEYERKTSRPTSYNAAFDNETPCAFTITCKNPSFDPNCE